jgi:septum formation inhibitor MinC
MSYDLNEHWFNTVYDMLAKEQSNLLNSLKTNEFKEVKNKEKNYNKQVQLLTHLLGNLIKLRNIRKDLMLLNIS